jgi:lysophospholipase L1-like esterase
MNTNPQAKVVLCYGDSNTWGQNDDKNYAGRHVSNVRWTGKLQELLEHYDPAKQSRNGLTYFKPSISSHSPLDVVVIMLGTNDLKLQYQRTASEIANTLKLFVDEARYSNPKAKVLLVSPIFVDDTAPKFVEYYDGTYDKVSADKSRQLGNEIKRVADETGSLFLDASKVAKAGKDGIHFDEQSHLALAQVLVELLK